jgi:hypothetical protein
MAEIDGILCRTAGPPVVGAYQRGGRMRANSLQIKLDRFANMCVLTAKGEIDLTNHHLLGQTLDQLDDGVAPLLDLRDVQHLDS